MPATTDACAAIVARALAGGADAAQATCTTRAHFGIEFENRAISAVHSTRDAGLALTVFRGGKRGTATANGTDPAAIDGALEAALAASAAGLADPANDIADAPTEPESVHGHAQPDRDAMMQSVADCIDELERRYPRIRYKNSGYAFDVGERAFANSRGVMQCERRAHYGFGIAFVAKDGHDTSSFNWAGGTSVTPFARLLDAGVVRRVLDEALASLDPRPVPEKFVGDVIMTPECLAGFVGMLAGALGGGALLAGTTPYKDRQGERIADARFSLLNRPRAAEFALSAAFDDYGVPTRDLDVVRDGVLTDFLVDFQMARKLGRPQTAGRWNLVVPSGETPLADIIANTRRGLLLCRFSGGVPTANLDFSGVAKNSFYVEDGAICQPLIETMVSGNLQDLLQNVRAVSRESVNFGDSRYPYLAAGGVTISSKG